MPQRAKNERGCAPAWFTCRPSRARWSLKCITCAGLCELNAPEMSGLAAFLTACTLYLRSLMLFRLYRALIRRAHGGGGGTCLNLGMINERPSHVAHPVCSYTRCNRHETCSAGLRRSSLGLEACDPLPDLRFWLGFVPPGTHTTILHLNSPRCLQLTLC
jgi:hypothetical protein